MIARALIVCGPIFLAIWAMNALLDRIQPFLYWLAAEAHR